MRLSPIILAIVTCTSNVNAFTMPTSTRAFSTRSSLSMNIEAIETKDIRVGVIGCGRIGVVHLGAITKAPNVSATIVSNPTVSKAEAGTNSIPRYSFFNSFKRYIYVCLASFVQLDSSTLVPHSISPRFTMCL